MVIPAELRSQIAVIGFDSATTAKIWQSLERLYASSEMRSVLNSSAGLTWQQAVALATGVSEYWDPMAAGASLFYKIIISRTTSRGSFGMFGTRIVLLKMDESFIWSISQTSARTRGRGCGRRHSQIPT